MYGFIWFLVAVVVIAIIFPKENRKKVKASTVGLCSYVYEQSVAKNTNVQKVAALFEENQELSNSEIKEALNVSSRSVVRYLDQLEKENVVEQVGDTGRGVVYMKV